MLTVIIPSCLAALLIIAIVAIAANIRYGRN